MTSFEPSHVCVEAVRAHVFLVYVSAGTCFSVYVIRMQKCSAGSLSAAVIAHFAYKLCVRPSKHVPSTLVRVFSRQLYELIYTRFSFCLGRNSFAARKCITDM